MIYLSAITFIAAFLLFQIELIIAKLFLPLYGGSYLVWGACVVFFQAVLLGGYVFAHHFIQRFSIGRYLKIHVLLLVLPFFVFPRTNIHLQAYSSALPLVVDVFVRLLLTIGPVFFVLSTVSLVAQSWLMASSRSARTHPYILYAVSNAGSFAALWSYPFLFENVFANSMQLNIWRMMYLVLVFLTVMALRAVGVNAATAVPADAGVPVRRATAMRWLVLSAASVVLFLSVTNIITYEVAPLPLLWIVPLSLYLLSFILAFQKRPLLWRWLDMACIIVIFLAVLLYFEAKLTFLPAAWSIILFNGALLVLCLWASRELIKSKPTDNQLTYFYVMISLGGFIGGIVTSWIVPLLTHTLLEFLLGLLLIAWMFERRILRFMLMGFVVVAMLVDSCVEIHTWIYHRLPSIEIKRNYYGIYDVYDTRSGVRTFVHGTTLHGIEWNMPERRFIPLGYYSPNSPLGEILIKDFFKARHIGAVGLGAGTIAMYTKEQLSMDFYELDPDVVTIAKNHFWYLKLAPGLVNVHLGDARLSLEKTPEAIYDLLVIDAFGGDSIPVHLINRDVVTIYRKHLNSTGGILFHIPNRYFNLEAVLAHIAHDLGAYAAVKEAAQDGITLKTYWAVMTWDADKYVQLIAQPGWRPLDINDYKPMRTWDDDFSTVLPIIKFDEIFQSLEHFKLY